MIMRLIDADIADVVIIYDKSNELTPVSEVREHIKRQKAFLDKFPTIDAVPVVRCRECKHCDPENHHCDHPMGTTAPLRRKPDDFCSYGDRKEGADNGRVYP